MQTVNLRKVGGSVMLTVPRAMLDELRLGAGATVGISVQDGRMVIEPQPRPRYTLEGLLAEMASGEAALPDDPDWVNGAAVGREIL